MLWFYLALITAVLWTVEHTLAKKILKSEKPEYVSLLSSFFSVILSIILLIIFKDSLVFTKSLLWVLIPVALTNATARILYAKSLKFAELSKTIPLLSLSPIFTLFFAFFILGESPPFAAVFGIFFAIVGIYLINMNSNSNKILEPFKNIFYNKGVFFMFLVASIYGLGGVLDKYGVSHANVITYLLLTNPVSFLAQTAYIASKDKSRIFTESLILLRKKWFSLVILALVAFVTITFQFWAVSLTYSSYVIAIKRTSALFSVIVGYILFKERKNIWKTLIGTIIILIGTYFVLFN